MPRNSVYFRRSVTVCNAAHIKLIITLFDAKQIPKNVCFLITKTDHLMVVGEKALFLCKHLLCSYVLTDVYFKRTFAVWNSRLTCWKISNGHVENEWKIDKSSVLIGFHLNACPPMMSHDTFFPHMIGWISTAQQSNRKTIYN